jgi:hypothetical protein
MENLNYRLKFKVMGITAILGKEKRLFQPLFTPERFTIFADFRTVLISFSF